MCSMFDSHILISPSLLDEFSNIDEIAFVFAFNLMDFVARDYLYNPMKEDFKIFFQEVIKSNVNLYNGRYTEDLNFILNDLKKTNLLKEYVLINPLFHLSFSPQLKKLQKELLEKTQEINFKKINLALDIIHIGGYNLKNISNIDFSKIDYQHYDIVIYFLIQNDVDFAMKENLEKLTSHNVSLRIKENNNEELSQDYLNLKKEYDQFNII